MAEGEQGSNQERSQVGGVDKPDALPSAVRSLSHALVVLSHGSYAFPMPKPRLDDIIAALETSNDSIDAWFDRQTGNIVEISEDDRAAADGSDADVPDWQREAVILTRAVDADERVERFVPLPSTLDLNEWQVMADFADSLSSKQGGDRLASAIRGSGAFGRFKREIASLNLIDAWHVFRRDALRRVVLQWCEENGLGWD